MGLFILSRAILLTACGILVFTINYVRSETKDSLNCFSEEDSNCEKNAIKISSEYYGCDMVLNIPNPPKRIGSINANVVVQIGDQTFNLRNDKLLLSSTNIILPPADDFYDYSYNRFYVNRRGAFMRDDRLRKEFEIVTSGSRGIQQLALDLQNRNLFILTMTPRGTNGSVYLVKTDQKESSGGKIKAVKVQELGNDITAIATEERANRVLLGMKTESGGKLIRLKKLDRHPCATTNGGEDLIETIIKEAKEKILKAISEISIQPSKANLVDRSAPADKSLQMENAKLKRELLVANTKLNAITSKMFGFRKNIQPMPQHSLAQVTKRKEQRIQYSQTNYMEIPVPYGGYYPSSGSSRAESPPEQSSNSYFIPSHVITEESNQSSDGEPSQTDESLDTVLDQIFGNPISPCSGYQCPQFIPPPPLPPPEFSMSPTCNCAELVFNNHTQIMEIEKLQKALDDMSASVKSILEGTDVPADAAADYIDPID